MAVALRNLLLALSLGVGGCGQGEEGAVDTTLPEPVEATPPPAAPAIISGELSFPSDYIPEDMTVCAVEVGTGASHCDSEKAGERTYRLAVPAGRYRVYARTDAMPGYRAYYSDAVICGLHAGCSSHEPITIAVAAGETRTSVDPGDWYVPQAGRADPRPPAPGAVELPADEQIATFNAPAEDANVGATRDD